MLERWKITWHTQHTSCERSRESYPLTLGLPRLPLKSSQTRQSNSSLKLVLQGKRLNCILHMHGYICIIEVYAIYCVYIMSIHSGLVITQQLMIVYLILIPAVLHSSAHKTSTQFPRGQKHHRRHVCISDIQVDTAQFLSRRQQKETSVGFRNLKVKLFSQSFDFGEMGFSISHISLRFFFFWEGGGQVWAASKHPYKGGMEAFQNTKQHQSTKTNHCLIKA